MTTEINADEGEIDRSVDPSPAATPDVGIPQGKVMLLNGYDAGYPGDGLATPVDPDAPPTLRDAAASVDPKFAAQGWMAFGGGTWKVSVPGALGDMMFPRQRPLTQAGLDPEVRYRVGGAIDASVNPPVLDVQLIENAPPRRRQWIVG